MNILDAILISFISGAAEMLAMEMKASGMYVSRGLSFRQAEVIKFFDFVVVDYLCQSCHLTMFIT